MRSVDFSPLKDLAAKLALFSSTPSVNIAVGRQYDKMVIARSNGGDLFLSWQRKNWGREGLISRTIGEA